MPTYTPLSYVFANDEDICIRAEGDFAVLVPKAQRRASGSDGVIGPGSWTLTSPSVNFAAQGVAAGNVVQVSVPPAGKTALPGEKADFFAVDSAAGNALTFRRVGESSGVGQPPTAAGSSGVAFLIQTFGPQIEDATYDLERRYGINQMIPGRTTADFFDPREVNRACVLEVLRRQCVAQARAGTEGADTLWAKAKDYAAEFDDVIGRGILHWKLAGNFGLPTEPITSRFGMRISR